MTPFFVVQLHNLLLTSWSPAIGFFVAPQVPHGLPCLFAWRRGCSVCAYTRFTDVFCFQKKSGRFDLNTTKT